MTQGNPGKELPSHYTISTAPEPDPNESQGSNSLHRKRKHVKVKILAAIALMVSLAPSGLCETSNILASTAAAVKATNSPASPTFLHSSNWGGYVPDDQYKLRIGDKVSFQILEDRDAPRSLVVADSGELEVPYLGRVPAMDQTCKQVAGQIKEQLEKDYYYHASVVLALDSASRLLGRVYVWGQVRNQGPIELSVNETLTAGKAILRAGGFGDFANKKKVKIVRPAAHGSAKQVFELNMNEILEDGQVDKDLVLQADDSVIVGSRLINF